VDGEQMKQVLINLVQNAADSIGRDGAITLRARADRKPLGQVETDVVILEVADTGSGITPEVEKRLFDPFFTTKPEGTGP
jgi:signal transduction histidine kinase